MKAWQNSLHDDAAIRRDLFVESPFAHPSVMFRRDRVQEAGAYRNCGWAEDYDLWLRLARLPGGFARRPETLLYWRDRAATPDPHQRRLQRRGLSRLQDPSSAPGFSGRAAGK